jgi:hypothetical protein
MLNLNRIWGHSALVLLLAANCTAVGAANPRSDAESLAALGGDSGQIVLAVNPGVQNAAGSVLTVAYPDGGVKRREFQGSDAPFISGPLPDGTYTYELSINPAVDPATRKTLQAARQAADGQEALPAVARLQAQGKIPSGPQVQSGSFTIEDGALVSPDATE